MGILAIGKATTTGTDSNDTPAINGPGDRDFDAILAAFNKAAHETPEERARDAVLKKHKLSEEDYKKLPPKEREAIDQEVAAAVRKLHERKTGIAFADTPLPTEKMFGTGLAA